MLGSYTLVDGDTGQKLVDEKDIGNNESIRTEYEIEEVDIECEDPQWQEKLLCNNAYFEIWIIMLSIRKQRWKLIDP